MMTAADPAESTVSCDKVRYVPKMGTSIRCSYGVHGGRYQYHQLGEQQKWRRLPEGAYCGWNFPSTLYSVPIRLMREVRRKRRERPTFRRYRHTHPSLAAPVEMVQCRYSACQTRPPLDPSGSAFRLVPLVMSRRDHSCAGWPPGPGSNNTLRATEIARRIDGRQGWSASIESPARDHVSQRLVPRRCQRASEGLPGRDPGPLCAPSRPHVANCGHPRCSILRWGPSLGGGLRKLNVDAAGRGRPVAYDEGWRRADSTTPRATSHR